MVSLLLLTVVWLAAVEALIISSYTSSYSRHKIQAIYFAQRALEEQRRLYSINMPSQPEQSFTISPDNFTIRRTITITTVNSPGGISAHTKKVQIAVNWNEKFYSSNVPAAEYCATDITDEPHFD